MEHSNKARGEADAMSGILNGADMQSRLVIIEQKLDAIMDFLGMTKQWPAHSSQGAVQEPMSNNGSPEPYMVFRNVTFENQSQNALQKSVVESETFGNVHCTPRPHSAAAVHDLRSGSCLVSKSQPKPQGKVAAPHVNVKETQGIPPRHGNVFSGRALSYSSSGDFFEFTTDSIASSARSSRDGGRDSLNSGKQSTGTVSVTIYAENTGEPLKKSVAATDSVSGVNKNEGGRSSRSGLYKDPMCPVNREVLDAINKSQKDWKNVAPMRPCRASSGVSLESCTTTSVKSEGPISKQDLSQRGKTSRSCTQSGTSRSFTNGSKSRRDLLRTSSARDNHSMQGLRSPGSARKHDACSNAEVVRQIKEKIMEIRQKDGIERISRDGPPVPKPQRVDRTSLKYYGRVDMGRVAWHA